SAACASGATVDTPTSPPSVSADAIAIDANFFVFVKLPFECFLLGNHFTYLYILTQYPKLYKIWLLTAHHKKSWVTKSATCF
ncbi:hypothetical protein, partial [Lysinibacillus sp. TE18511]